MNTIRERIQGLLTAKKWSVTKLAQEIDKSSTSKVRLNRQINGDTTVSAETIELILTTFPDVSAEWLLRGTGDMFLWQSTIDNAERKDEGKEQAESAESAGGASVAELHREIAELRKDKENLMLLLTQITKR